MTDKEKVEELRKVIFDTLWMAIRYAHGRHTYAPDMVRDAVRALKQIFPDFKLREDITIQPPTPEEYMPNRFSQSRKDWLDDLFKDR